MRPIHSICKILGLSIGFALVSGLAVQAQSDNPGFSSFNVQYLYGFNWDTEPNRRDVFTIEHYAIGSYGDHFFFLDVTNITGDRSRLPTDVYGEWQPRLSLSKLTGQELSNGFVLDVYAANEVNFGAGFFAHVHGLGFAFDLLGLDFLNLNGYLRNDLGLSGMTWQVSMSGQRSFRVGALPISYGGFVDLMGPEGNSEVQMLTQTQFLFDVSRAVGLDNTLAIGVEFLIWLNQFGIQGQDEVVPQVMMRWIL